jgi:hypothetical protein
MNMWYLSVSREEVDIQKELSIAEVLKLEDRCGKLGIWDFITHYSIRIQEKFDISEEAREELVRMVCKRSNETMLVARNIMEDLYQQVSVKDLYDESRLERSLEREQSCNNFESELKSSSYKGDLSNEVHSLEKGIVNTLPESSKTVAAGLPKSRPGVITSGDSGHGSMATRTVAREWTRKERNPSRINEDIEKWDLRSVASLESHATYITVSSINPATKGGRLSSLRMFCGLIAPSDHYLPRDFSPWSRIGSNEIFEGS